MTALAQKVNKIFTMNSIRLQQFFNFIISLKSDSINGKHYAMELHVVFYKDSYGSMDNATKHADGLAVMAFFFKVADHTNTAYRQLAESLELIKKPHTKTTIAKPHVPLDYVSHVECFVLYLNITDLTHVSHRCKRV